MTSLLATLNYFDSLRAIALGSEERIHDLRESNDYLLAENTRLRRELEAARRQRDDACARANTGRMAP